MKIDQVQDVTPILSNSTCKKEGVAVVVVCEKNSLNYHFLLINCLHVSSFDLLASLVKRLGEYDKAEINTGLQEINEALFKLTIKQTTVFRRMMAQARVLSHLVQGSGRMALPAAAPSRVCPQTCSSGNRCGALSGMLCGALAFTPAC